jgi:hypothetical protein
MSLPARRAPSVPTIPARIDVEGAVQAPVRLFVDGLPAGLFEGAHKTAAVTRGAHVFAVETLDGAYGSADTSARIDAPGDPVTLALYPERAVSGRVVLADPHSVDEDFSFAGIVVTIGNAATETNADGSFAFGKQPIAPDAMLAVDQGSLPRELRAPDPAPVRDGELILVLHPALHVEHRTFSSSGSSTPK